MALRSNFVEWGTLYPSSKTKSFANNVVADWIRTELPASIRAAGRPNTEGLIIKGSAGAGNWATVPWVALFEPSVTSSATSGYYVVYLLGTDGKTLHLSLNQGTTAVREEFGSRSSQILRERASFMRQRVAEYLKLLPDVDIFLGNEPGLPAAYVAGHALGKTYAINHLPDEATLVADLHAALEAYRALVFRGGLDLEAIEAGAEVLEGGTIEERRRYRMHLRVERNPRAGLLAKRHHGYRCQTCGFDFLVRYGELGRDYIEAHHLKPISSLSEGVAVRYDIATDFAVLCANCHRMIHRLPDVSRLDKIRDLLAKLP